MPSKPAKSRPGKAASAEGSPHRAYGADVGRCVMASAWVVEVCCVYRAFDEVRCIARSVWVASTDYRRDVHVGHNVLAKSVDWLFKIRNTARFMLGNLAGYDVGSHYAIAPSGSLDMVAAAWAAAPTPAGIAALSTSPINEYYLHRCARLQELVGVAYKEYNFGRVCAVMGTAPRRLTHFIWECAAGCEGRHTGCREGSERAVLQHREGCAVHGGCSCATRSWPTCANWGRGAAGCRTRSGAGLSVAFLAFHDACCGTHSGVYGRGRLPAHGGARVAPRRGRRRQRVAVCAIVERL